MFGMIIRTKIVATVGPACGEKQMIKTLVEAGVDVFRINFSHGDTEQREGYLRNIRQVEAELGAPVAVMADLCGPKIRVGMITGGAVLLADGQEVIVQREPIVGDAGRISTTLAELVDEVAVGESILIDDGRIRMEIVETNAPESFRCRVVHGGPADRG